MLFLGQATIQEEIAKIERKERAPTGCRKMPAQKRADAVVGVELGNI
jgi:hypothetical protein